MSTTGVKPVPEGYHTVTPYLMLADEHPDMGALSAKTVGGSPRRQHAMGKGGGG